MATRVKKTLEEQLVDAEAKVEDIKNRIKESKKAVLSIDSEGMKEAIDAVDAAAKANSATIGDVLIRIAKIKRTGLTIAKAARSKKKADDDNSAQES